MRYLKEPPMIPTFETPDSILGDELQLYTKHYRLWMKGPEQVDKQLQRYEIQKVAELNMALLNNGFRPLYLDSKGEIVWGIATIPTRKEGGV